MLFDELDNTSTLKKIFRTYQLAPERQKDYHAGCEYIKRSLCQYMLLTASKGKQAKFGVSPIMRRSNFVTDLL
jgi:hypothetical protein